MRKRGTVSTLRLLAAIALAPLCASAQSAAPPVRSIDIYGSSALDSAAARAEFGTDTLRFSRARLAGGLRRTGAGKRGGARSAHAGDRREGESSARVAHTARVLRARSDTRLRPAPASRRHDRRRRENRRVAPHAIP